MRKRKIDRVASVGRSKGEGWQPKQVAIYAVRKSKARIETASVRRRRRSSVDEDRRCSLFRKERNESNEQLATIVGCESAKSSEGRQRIAESHGQTAEGGPREREQGWQRRRRTKSKKILSTPLGNRRAAAWNEGAKRMRTRDERAKRERQIDRTSGRLESGIEEKERRGRLLFTLRRSRRLRVRSLKKNCRKERTEKRQRTQGRKNRTNRASHGESAINQKKTIVMLIRI